MRLPVLLLYLLRSLRECRFFLCALGENRPRERQRDPSESESAVTVPRSRPRTPSRRRRRPGPPRCPPPGTTTVPLHPPCLAPTPPPRRSPRGGRRRRPSRRRTRTQPFSQASETVLAGAVAAGPSARNRNRTRESSGVVRRSSEFLTRSFESVDVGRPRVRLLGDSRASDPPGEGVVPRGVPRAASRPAVEPTRFRSPVRGRITRTDLRPRTWVGLDCD